MQKCLCGKRIRALHRFLDAHPELTSGDRIVLLALHLRADLASWAFEPSGEPSGTRVLAADTGLSRRGVQIAIRHLETAGAVEVERRQLPNGQHAPNSYRLRCAP